MLATEAPRPRKQTLVALLHEAEALALALIQAGASARTAIRQVIDTLPVAALVADDDGHYVMANALAADLTGFSSRELLRRSVWHLTPAVNEREAETLWRAFLHESGSSGWTRTNNPPVNRRNKKR